MALDDHAPINASTLQVADDRPRFEDLPISPAETRAIQAERAELDGISERIRFDQSGEPGSQPNRIIQDYAAFSRLPFEEWAKQNILERARFDRSSEPGAQPQRLGQDLEDYRSITKSYLPIHLAHEGEMLGQKWSSVWKPVPIDRMFMRPEPEHHG